MHLNGSRKYLNSIHIYFTLLRLRNESILGPALCRRTFQSDATTNDKRNHYEVLGLPPNATAKDIKQAFYEKSKQHHPDLVGTANGSQNEFVRVNEAYQTLSDQKTRDQYDQQLSDGRSAGHAPPTGSGLHHFDSQMYSEYYRKRRKAMEEQGFRPRPDPHHIYAYRKNVAQPNRQKMWLRYEEHARNRHKMLIEERKYMIIIVIMLVVLMLMTGTV